MNRTKTLDPRTLTAEPERRLFVPAAFLLLLAACGGGGGLGTGASGNSVGDLIDHPDASGGTSKRLIVDANFGGKAQNLYLTQIFWGRLVDVYDLSDTGERSLQQKDYLIGEDIISDGQDFLVETNPVTQQTSVVILHQFDDPQRRYAAAFQRLDKNLEVLQDEDLSSSGVYTMVPRNAAIMLRFSDLLDPELIRDDTIRLFTGSPPEVPFEFRLRPDTNHGDVLSKNGVPTFYTTRVLLDSTVTELESFEGQDTIPINGVGLPASNSANLPNVVLRIPTVEKPGIGQSKVLRNLTGHKLATTSNGTIDFGSQTVDLLRAFRSGGATLVTGDPYNGFLRDDLAPSVVGRQPAFIFELPQTDPDGADELDFILPEVTFLSEACSQTPREGDILRQSGIFAIVREAGLPPVEGRLFNLKVRLLLGDPADWVTGGVGSVEYLSIFDPVGNDGQQSCFVQILPTPDGFPLKPTEGMSTQATIAVRFSEPMNPASMTAFDSLTLTRVEHPEFTYEYVVGRVVQSQDLQSFTFVPDLPLAHNFGDEESYFLTLSEGALGPTDLSGNGLAFALPAIPCKILADAAPQLNGGRVTRFTSTDEEAPFGDDITGSLPEWTGQHLINLERQLIRPRPVVRTQRAADRNQPVPSQHTPFPQGVQTPLSGLGSKMQTVYRYVDFNFGLTDNTFANIDVEGMYWSPAGGNVIADHYTEFEIRLCHAKYLPDEYIDPSSLFPMWPNSGLKRTFSTNILDGVNDPQKIVHEKARGYTVNPADVTQTVSGTPVIPYPLNRGKALGDYTFYTWRDTALLARGGAGGGGADNNVLCQVLGVGQCGLMSAGQVSTIGLPLLMEFRCYPDTQALGLNGLDINLAANSSARPDFRAFSTGGTDQSQNTVTRDPDLEDEANGGFNPNSNPPGATTWGLDNTFYIGGMDFVSRLSRTYSLWFPVVPAEVTVPVFNQPITEPRLEDQPNGTSITLAFRGASQISNQDALDNANTLDGYGDHYAEPDVNRNSSAANVGITFLGGSTDWRSDVSEINGAKYYQVRVTFLANHETGTVPELSALGLTWAQQ